jgi:ComF family protein
MEVKAAFKFFLDLLFPIECLGCSKEGEYICEPCFHSIPTGWNFCLFCRRPSLEGRLCLMCVPRHAIDRVFIAGDYNSKTLKNAIRALKYSYVEDLKKPLGKFLIQHLQYQKVFFEHHDIVIVPMPLSKTRFRERGFNQAELLAREVAEYLRLPLLTSALLRARHTDAQVGLTEDERRENIAGAFKVKSFEEVKDKSVLLIDDVATTGATLEEAAKVLKNAGAKEVWGAVLAKG